MRIKSNRMIAAFLLLTLTVGLVRGQSSISPSNPQARPTDTWVVQVQPGTDLNALTAQLGLIYAGPVPNLPGYHLYRAAGINAAAPNVSGSITNRLAGATDVSYAQQLVKRQYEHRVPEDPLYTEQWHLNNSGQSGTEGNDANVQAAWALGYTGAGVVVATVDDGPEYMHPDLAANWLSSAAYDYFSDDPDPAPVYGGSPFGSPQPGEAHGTSVAGVMAAANETNCGVGVAYDATLTGIRLVVPSIVGFDDAQIASSLAHAVDVIDVMNNSWGAPDNGRAWDQLSQIVLDALEKGASEGREGKGRIYIWAGGNGGGLDHSGADGFVNSRYTLAVAASTHEGTPAIYSERGAALVVNAPSSGSGGGITTTDRAGTTNGYNGYEGGDCTDGFGGTSASAPIVSGVVALMLEANPNLTWRDVQAILIETAEQNDPLSPEWTTNGAGYKISHDHGFGRVDAAAAVSTAATWTNLPPEGTLSSVLQLVDEAIPDDDLNGVEASFTFQPDMLIESVEVIVNATHASRGDLQIELVSPAGTVSNLLEPRSADQPGSFATTANISDYPFLSMRHFGESAQGTWTLRVIDTRAEYIGTFDSFTLNLYGEALSYTGERLTNAGFESFDAESKLPLDWKAKNIQPGDKVKGNRVDHPTKPDKVRAYEGERAFQFKGRPNKATKLIQVADLVALDAGQTLDLSAYVNTVNMTYGAKIVLRANYSDETRSKEVLRIPTGTTEDYVPLQGQLTLTDVPTKVKVKIQYRNPNATGKFFIDALSLVTATETTAEELLTLPERPDEPSGFRR